MRRFIILHGYSITTALPTGGKAGKGHNKTSTVQVFKGDMKVKQFVYKLMDFGGQGKAFKKAEKWIEDNRSKANPCECGCEEYYLAPIVGARCQSCNKPLTLKK